MIASSSGAPWQTAARGILAVKVVLDPRQVVRELRALCERQPGAFRYTLKWVPVDRWTRPELPAMKAAVAQLRASIGPNEVIRSLAALVDARVDLCHPDKLLVFSVARARRTPPEGAASPHVSGAVSPQ